VKRAARLADAYVPIAGHGTFRPRRDSRSGLVDVPGSAFLRPHSPRLRRLDPLKVNRIKRAMSHAAGRSEVFHLWWHPHNFGVDLRENMATLAAVLDHLDALRRTHGMQSLSMAEAASALA
jgi:hypothetical protein